MLQTGNRTTYSYVVLLNKLYYTLVNLDILYLYFILTAVKLPNNIVLLYIRIKQMFTSNTFL